MKLWRISGFGNLTGEGGMLASARWHTKGRPVVYLADSPASAMLERLVQIVRQAGISSRNYTLLEIEADSALAVESLMHVADAGWRDRVDISQNAGDRWLSAAKTPLARVPSAVAPRTWNYLLNPLHPDANRVQILSQIQEIFDPRLLESRPR